MCVLPLLVVLFPPCRHITAHSPDMVSLFHTPLMSPCLHTQPPHNTLESVVIPICNVYSPPSLSPSLSSSPSLSPSLSLSPPPLISLSQMLHKQLPFAGCHIALEGFSEEEAQHMRDIATDNGETAPHTSFARFYTERRIPPPPPPS